MKNNTRTDTDIRCKNENNKSTFTDFYKEEEYFPLASKKNKNNDCKYFEEKEKVDQVIIIKKDTGIISFFNNLFGN